VEAQRKAELETKLAELEACAAQERAVQKKFEKQPRERGILLVRVLFSRLVAKAVLQQATDWPLSVVVRVESPTLRGSWVTSETTPQTCAWVGENMLTVSWAETVSFDLDELDVPLPLASLRLSVCRVDGDAAALLATARVQMPMMTSQGVHGSGMTLSLKGVGRRGAGSKQVGDIQLQLSWLRNTTGSGGAAATKPAALTIRPPSWPGGPSTNRSPLTARVRMGPSPAVASVAEAASASLPATPRLPPVTARPGGGAHEGSTLKLPVLNFKV